MKNMFIIFVICLSVLIGSSISFADVTNNGSVDNSGVADSESFSGASISTDSDVYDRKFANVGIVPLPTLNNFFVEPTTDSSFMDVVDFLHIMGGPNCYLIRISEDALKRMEKGGDVEDHFQVVNDENLVPRVYTKNYDGIKYLWFGVEKPVFNEEMKIIGTQRIAGLQTTVIVDGEADDGDTNSLQIWGKLGLQALEDGNNFLIITQQNHHRMVNADGWGIGAYVGGGLTNTAGKESLSPGAGTGYATGKSITEDKPWVRGYAGCLITPEIASLLEASKNFKKAETEKRSYKRKMDDRYNGR